MQGARAATERSTPSYRQTGTTLARSTHPEVPLTFYTAVYSAARPHGAVSHRLTTRILFGRALARTGAHAVYSAAWGSAVSHRLTSLVGCALARTPYTRPHAVAPSLTTRFDRGSKPTSHAHPRSSTVAPGPRRAPSIHPIAAIHHRNLKACFGMKIWRASAARPGL